MSLYCVRNLVRVSHGYYFFRFGIAFSNFTMSSIISHVFSGKQSSIDKLIRDIEVEFGMNIGVTCDFRVD